MRQTTYINSLLDMERPLERKRLLAVKRAKALRSEITAPILEVQVDTTIQILSSIVEQIQQGVNLNRNELAESENTTVKYRPKIL